MKRTISVLSCALLIACAPSLALKAEQRTFTSNDGRTLMAELVAADVTNATLEFTDGRKSVVPLTRLSAQDQTYVKDWIKSHPMAIRYSFTIDWSKEKAGSNRSNEGVTLVTQNRYVCHFKITNRATVPLEDVEAHLQVYYKVKDGNAESEHHVDCVRNIPSMAAGQTVTVESDPVTIYISELQGGYYYKNGSSPRQADSVRGTAATLVHAGKEVFEFVSTGIKKAPEELKRRTGSDGFDPGLTQKKKNN
jgi:hypothetical protein